MKSVAIVQSNYIPWRGYFDLISSVDEFILLDDVQYTSPDWRNRNRIKTSAGPMWLTISVDGSTGRRIDEVEAADPGWAAAHLRTLTQSYRAAPGFEQCEPWLGELYDNPPRMLTDINRAFLVRICEELGIQTPLTSSTDYKAGGRRTERLVELCSQAGADEYVSGPAAHAYLDEARFEAAGIAVSWFEYPDYREYPQLHPPYEARVSILDLLFSTGRRAHEFLSPELVSESPGDARG